MGNFFNPRSGWLFGAQDGVRLFNRTLTKGRIAKAQAEGHLFTLSNRYTYPE
jgi:hypothetical protein